MRATISTAGLSFWLIIGFLILLWIGAILTVSGNQDLIGWLAALGSEFLPAPGWSGR